MTDHLVEGVKAIELPVDETDAPPIAQSVKPIFVAYEHERQNRPMKSISQLAEQAAPSVESDK